MGSCCWFPTKKAGPTAPKPDRVGGGGQGAVGKVGETWKDDRKKYRAAKNSKIYIDRFPATSFLLRKSSSADAAKKQK